MQKEKCHLLDNQYLQGKRTLQTNTRTEDKNTYNTVYSPTDKQSYQHTDRRQKYIH